MPALCRDCLRPFEPRGRCPACGSPRTVAHAELNALSLAHIDCDAFYAAVEKRDDPALRDRPVIVGGGRRGVVATCCYIARIRGVRSAMPMFKALAACPDAVVLKPRMAVYAEVSRQIRARMEALTPLVEPLSLDEAFLDLSGTERLHGAPPALMLARLQAAIERDIGVTVSVGLSHNKFLAKLASERDKPRGFAVIGRAETEAVLEKLPVRALWGVGRSLAQALAAEGLDTVADLRRAGVDRLMRLYGSTGQRLHALAWGRDTRIVAPGRAAKSLSAETTFEDDIAAEPALQARLWPLCVKVSDRLKSKGLMAQGVVLKLRRHDFRLLTRSHRLTDASALAETLYRAALPLLADSLHEGPFRLIGIGAAPVAAGGAGTTADMLGGGTQRLAAVEQATDSIRARFGDGAIRKGRGLLDGKR